MLVAQTETTVSLFKSGLRVALPCATFYFSLLSRVKKPNKAATQEPDVLADCYSFGMKNPAKELSESEVSRVVEMAWEDRTPFEVIEATFGPVNPRR